MGGIGRVIMDKIRDSLNKDKQKGIPFDNSRMMDELLQFHAGLRVCIFDNVCNNSTFCTSTL
jgi:hypothetical protein